MADPNPTWWLSLDGWQLESGEVPRLAVGSIVDYTLELQWIGLPVRSRGHEPARHHVRRNIYDVVATVAARLQGETIADVGDDKVLLSGGHASSTARPGQQFRGRVGAETSGVWGTLDASPHRRRLEVNEILMHSTTGRSKGEWTAVEKTLDVERVYLIHCSPALQQ